MNWILLILAGFFEIIWAIALKYSDGFSKLIPSIISFVSMTISIVLLGVVSRNLPIGTTYAVWTAIGACGTLLYGMFFLGESKDVLRIVCIVIIIFSIVILRITED